MDYSLPGSSVQGDSPGNNTGVGCHALLQGIFPIQGSNSGLPYCRQILYHRSYQGSPQCYVPLEKGALSPSAHLESPPSTLTHPLFLSTASPWLFPILAPLDQWSPFHLVPQLWLPTVCTLCSDQIASVNTEAGPAPPLPTALGHPPPKVQVLPTAHEALHKNVQGDLAPSLPFPPPSLPLAHSAPATQAFLLCLQQHQAWSCPRTLEPAMVSAGKMSQQKPT